LSKRAEALGLKFSEYENDLRVTAKEIRDAITKTQPPLAGRREELPSRASSAPAPAPPRGTGRPRPAPSTAPPIAATGDVDRYQADVLVALAKLHALGVSEAPKLHVAALANKSIRSSTWDNKLADLSKRGFVRYTGDGGMAATDAGLAAVPAQPPARGAEIIDGFRAMLSAYQNALFEPLLSAPTESLTREEWAERAGKSRTSSTFDNETAQMRAIGVIETESGGRVRLASRLAALL
jgi:hypothetical protein